MFPLESKQLSIKKLKMLVFLVDSYALFKISQKRAINSH